MRKCAYFLKLPIIYNFVQGQVEFGWGAAHSLEPHHTMHRGRYVDKGDNALGFYYNTINSLHTNE